MTVATNPLTEIITAAQELIEAREAEILSAYGLPLYTDVPTSKTEWPEDPEVMSPEAMAVLVQTRGEQAVNTWLAEHYQRKAEAEQYGVSE